MVLVTGLELTRRGGLSLEEMGIFLINKIYREDVAGKARLIFDVTENGQNKQVYFEVEEKYGEYLCYERCDAIVIGFLSYAMRGGLDIKSEVPITEELLYNLNEYLIPALTKYDAKLTAIKIDAPTAEPLPNAGAVGTGISCGVDSFHTILSHTNTPYKSRNVTHVVINNVGSFNIVGYEKVGSESVRDVCYERARKVARELNLPLIETGSDFPTVFPPSDYQAGYNKIDTYASTFAVHCLQKFWKIFYYSSAYDLGDFRLKNNSDYGSCLYDIFSLNCFSTDKLRIYSGGAALDRLQKVEQIADNKIVQENLHVCWEDSHNCGRCGKCQRTILELYALGKLEKFDKVFAVEDFEKNKNHYLRWLYEMHLSGDTINEPTYQSLIQHDQALKHEIQVYEKRKRRNKIFETILSVKNENTSDTTRKVVTILGLRIKLKPKSRFP